MTFNLPIETKSAELIETKDENDHVAEIKAAVAGLTGDLEKRLAAERDHVDELEAKLNRLTIGGRALQDDQPSVETKAFGQYLRFGKDHLGPEEAKSLIVGDSTRGGYLAPPQFIAEVLKNVVQFSPVRQAARIGTTSAGSVLLPKRTGTPTATWVGENETRSETNSTYGMAEIQVNTAACWVDISQTLLEDSAIDINAELAFDLAQEYARIEGAAFVSGDGIKKPLGVLNDTGITSVNSGTAATVADADGQANGLINAFYALSPFYRNRSTWMMNGTTLASIRKLKDADKNYVWQPSLQLGQPETILGRPVIEAVDMPNEGAGLTPIVLGDFSFYRIFDKAGGMTVLRDDYTQQTVGNVRFHSRMRVGGQATLAEAFRKVKCSV